ncbi:MAG: hypothetical protein HPY79_09450 [Bacteroidales bacterium]|nr:hypothetical protein [Bacteroidales bacterium]
MRKLLYFVFIALISFTWACSGNGSDKQNNESKDSVSTSETTESTVQGQRYGIKSGIVYYEPIDIMGIKTTQILYFDDYGKKECRETFAEGNIMGIKTKKHSMSILDGDYSINFDLENITNNKDELKKEATKVNIKAVMSNMDLSALTEEMKKQMDYKEEGTEQVAGVTGTKYSVKLGSGRIYGVMYKNVPLKTDMAQIKMVASKFEENAIIPAEKFMVPADYKIIEQKQ